MRSPPILNPDRDFGTLPDQVLERRHTYWISQSLTEPGGSVGQRRRRWWRAWRDARTLDWQTSRNLGCATVDHEFLCLCHGEPPVVRPEWESLRRCDSGHYCRINWTPLAESAVSPPETLPSFSELRSPYPVCMYRKLFDRR